MTAVECVQAIRFALWHVFTLRGLTLWQKLQLALLKVIAVIGYHHGKLQSLQQVPPGTSPQALPQPETLEPSADGDVELTKKRSAVDGNNFIVVVVPVYASTEQNLASLLQTLQCLHQQQRTANLVVVVDDGSPVPVPSFIRRDDLKLIQLSTNRGPAAARNYGIAAAKEHGANIICFCDADCQPQQGWLVQMEQAQQETPGIVAGMTLSDASTTAVGLFHEVFGTLNGRKLNDGSVLYGCTCNLSISVPAVDLLFDTMYPNAAFEDVEFCIRAKKKGIPMTYQPTAVMRHHYGEGFIALFWQFQRYGRFERLTALKHKEYLPWLWASTEISCSD